MTLQALFQNHGFDALVPSLTAIDPENVPDNLYAFKEAFDDLRRMTPGDSGGGQIDVSTEVDTDADGNEIDRCLHASGCEGDAWDACLAKEVIFGTAVGEEKALAQILWQMTFWGFTPGREGFRGDEPRNKYEKKAKELERRQFLNYAKGIADSFETEHLCLTTEGWKKYRQREAHRNRAKRMRDARQERSIARLKRMGKVQRLIDLLDSTDMRSAYSDHYFDYLFDTKEICVPEFYSRTADKASRAQYLFDNITAYFHQDLSGFTNVEMIIAYSNGNRPGAEELRTLCKAIFPLTGLVLDDAGQTIGGYSPDRAIRIHFSTDNTLSHDFHILLICSR